MKTSVLLAGLLLLGGAPLSAQTTTTTTTETTRTNMPGPGMSSQQAFGVAKDGVDAELRSRVVSVYGTGTPAGVNTWWVIFYDPSVASHGRAVRVENNQIVRTYPAQGGVVYGDTLTFSPDQIHGADRSLATAQDYAARHAIAYDNVRVLLRLTTHDAGLRWRIQLLDGAVSHGFVFANAGDGSFAMYKPGRHGSGGGDSVEANANAAGNDIKNTFLGVGGDLQQFFTGERTVDQ